MTSTTIRMEESLKRDLTETLKSMGLSVSSFFTLAARQVVAQQRIPFEIKATAPVMTEETRRALVEAEAKMLGLLPDDGVSFSSGAEAVAWLEDE